jgi:hypothetical protein
VNYWSAVQPSGGKASITIEDNAADPVNGQNYLRFSTTGAGGGMGDTITTDEGGNPIDVIAGSSYKLEAYVRSTTGATVSGTMSLAAANGSTTTDSASAPFTVGGDWTPVQLTLEKALEFMAEDELVEITPGAVRMRKRILREAERRRSERAARDRETALAGQDG